MRIRSRIALCAALVLLGNFLIAEPVDEMRDLVDADDFGALRELYESFVQLDDFDEIETDLLDLAREQVVASNYEAAYQVLEILLAVNLLNPEAQDVFVAVNSLLDGRVPGSDAPAVPERDRRQPPEAASRESTPEEEAEAPVVAVVPRASDPPPADQTTSSEPVVAQQPTETVPPREPAAEILQLPPVSDGGTEQTSEPDAAQLPAETAAARDPAAPTASSTGGEPAAEELPTDAESDEPQVVRIEREPVPLTYEAFVGPVSLLGNASGFYRDFYGTGRFNLTYGLSFDARLFLSFPRLILGPEVSFNSHFWNLNGGSGDQLAYKVGANFGFPGLVQLPLFARLGFAQQWYLYGSAIPDVLITSFPTPTLGVMLRDLNIGAVAERGLSLGASLDLYLISLFTSYLSLGLDAAVTAELDVPVSEKMSIRARVGVRPQLLFALGNLEFAAKLQIGVGVVSHE